jgi:hypothetical protein
VVDELLGFGNLRDKPKLLVTLLPVRSTKPGRSKRVGNKDREIRISDANSPDARSSDI